MEYNEQNGFLEELLALRSEPWEAMATIPTGMSDFYTNRWSYDDNSNNPSSVQQTSFEEFSLPPDQSLNCSISEFYQPFGNELSAQEITDSSTNKLDKHTFCSSTKDYSLSVLNDENQALACNTLPGLEPKAPCNLNPVHLTEVPSDFINMGICLERKNKGNKLNGQPSKNLMAERRRRKRLNDRLSMLRSVVPKISKMDRTAILGDTIDYIKDLLERINNLQEETEVGTNQMNFISIFNDLKDKEVLVRNPPRFDVERRPKDTHIEISCAGKPGLLLSTVTTLDALGLEIQQCVISCFGDFEMQASCSGVLDHRDAFSSEDIKQALFRNAGHEGRCV